MAESTSDKEKTPLPEAEAKKKSAEAVQNIPKSKDLPETKKAPPVVKNKTTKAPAEPKPKKIVPPPSINNIILNSAIKIAKDVRAKSIFLFADIVEDLKQLEDISKKGNFVFLTKNIEMIKQAMPTGGVKIIELPSVDLTRTAITKLSVMKGLYSGFIEANDKILFLTGAEGLKYLDSILVLDIGKESQMLSSVNVGSIVEGLKPEVFEAVLNMAIELSRQGREGKSVGTVFVVGDDKKVMQLSRQMIFNPFMGYPEKERNIVNPDLRDTIKEFSALDGAFVISSDGVVLAAGRHLNAAAEKESLPMGLGSRHVAGAGITAVTDAIAFVLSESTGDVRIFKGGKVFMEIEKETK